MSQIAENYKSRSHFAKVENSSRLSKLLMFLSDGKEHSTLEIVKGTSLCAVNTAVHELRENNIPVVCKRVAKDLYTYQLADVGAKVEAA